MNILKFSYFFIKKILKNPFLKKDYFFIDLNEQFKNMKIFIKILCGKKIIFNINKRKNFTSNTAIIYN